MGQKVSPHGLRVGVIKDWDSKWYADKANFADYLVEDNKVREYVKKKLYVAGVSKVLIERAAENKMRVIVLTAKPGMVIGSSGAGIDNLRAELKKLTGKDIDISIEEVRRSEMDAQLTAESIAQALERRVSFRRAMKQAIGRTMKAGAKGIKVLCSGRLGGAEIARSEKYSEGNVPLHTLRADIDCNYDCLIHFVADYDTDFCLSSVSFNCHITSSFPLGLGFCKLFFSEDRLNASDLSLNFSHLNRIFKLSGYMLESQVEQFFFHFCEFAVQFNLGHFSHLL